MPIHNQSGIYAIFNLMNDKCYVGSAVNFKQREYKHRNELAHKRHHSRYLQFSVDKYGITNFIFVKLEYCPIENLIEREQWWIFKLIPEYNTVLVAGNVLGIKRSEETKRKISAAQALRLPASEVTRARMSIAAKEKIFTEVHIDNMRKAQLGRKHSEATKLKMSLAAKGKSKSKEHKKKNGEAHRNLDKWPHGSRCRCRECLDIKNKYYREKYAEKQKAFQS